jgi:hypothetical protein
VFGGNLLISVGTHTQSRPTDQISLCQLHGQPPRYLY